MAQSSDTDTRDTLPGNDPDLTDAERAILAEAGAQADTTAGEASGPEGAEEEPAPAQDDAPDEEAAASGQGDGEGDGDAGPDDSAAAAAEDGGEEAPAAPAQGGPVAFPTLSVGEERDFKAELQELKQKLDDGDLDDEQYMDAREEILIARTKWETQRELAAQLAEQNWAAQVQAFLRQPENAALLRSPEIQDLWSTMMQRAVNVAAAEGTPLTDDWEMMTRGRDLLYETLGLSATVEPPPAPEKPSKPPVKAPPMEKVPPTLSGAPAAAQTGAKVSGESLANASLEELERIGHGMSDAQWDEVLRNAPGAFVDD